MTKRGQNSTADTTASRVRPKDKARYHHGDLRGALIEAADALIGEHGPEGFTLAEACRTAGVSSAAAYRHFDDRGALIEAVAARGFSQLEVATREARDRYELGSVDGIVAMGQAYVAFAAAHPALFKLMFGRHPDVQREGVAPAAGKPCFQVLLDAVAGWLDENPVAGLDVLDVAMPLWTIVHGTSYLLIDRDFCAVAPMTDPDTVVARATHAFLGGLAR